MINGLESVVTAPKCLQTDTSGLGNQRAITAPKFLTLAVVSALSLAQGITVDSKDNNITVQYPTANNRQAEKYPATSIDTQSNVTDLLTQQVRKALNIAQYENFESGIESNLNRFINKIVLRHRKKAISSLRGCLDESSLPENVIVEAIRSLGEMEHASTKLARFIVILPYLSDESPIIRDAAALAFADLGDKGAISYLRSAADRERFSAIRESFLSVAEELEET